jgi:hypothetical protein
VGNIEGKSGDSSVGSKDVLELSYLHWNEHFIKKYNPDIFIHSWNVDLERELIHLFNPKAIVVEPQISFNIPGWIPGEFRRKQNHYSKWFSNQRATRLMFKYSK